MAKISKEYLGAIEFSFDNLVYDIGLRELKSGAFLGTWACPACSICGISGNPASRKEAAIELGKFNAAKHHDKCHASDARSQSNSAAATANESDDSEILVRAQAVDEFS